MQYHATMHMFYQVYEWPKIDIKKMREVNETEPPPTIIPYSSVLPGLPPTLWTPNKSRKKNKLKRGKKGTGWEKNQLDIETYNPSTSKLFCKIFCLHRGCSCQPQTT